MSDRLTETPDEVFEALMERWLATLENHLGTGVADASAVREAAEWRARFGNAIARERNRAAKRMATHQAAYDGRTPIQEGIVYRDANGRDWMPYDQMREIMEERNRLRCAIWAYFQMGDDRPNQAEDILRSALPDDYRPVGA